MQPISEEEQRILQPSIKYFQSLERCMVYFICYKFIILLVSVTLILQLFIQDFSIKIPTVLGLTAWGIVFIAFRRQRAAVPSISSHQSQIQRTILNTFLLIFIDLQAPAEIISTTCIVLLIFLFVRLFLGSKSFRYIGFDRGQVTVYLSIYRVVLHLILSIYFRPYKLHYLEFLIMAIIQLELIAPKIWKFMRLEDVETFEAQFQLKHQKYILKDLTLKMWTIYVGSCTLFIAHLQYQLSQSVYWSLLIFMAVIHSIQMLTYPFWAKESMLEYFQIKRKTAVQVSNGKFMLNLFTQRRQTLKQSTFLQQICIFCDKRAKVKHYYCMKLLFCFDCYQNYAVVRKKRCPICQFKLQQSSVLLCDYRQLIKFRELPFLDSYFREDSMYEITL